MTIQIQKRQLIEAINSIDNSQILMQLQSIVNGIGQTQKIHSLAQRPQKKLDIEQLKQEQDYKPERVKRLYGQWFKGESYLELVKILD